MVELYSRDFVTSPTDVQEGVDFMPVLDFYRTCMDICTLNTEGFWNL